MKRQDLRSILISGGVDNPSKDIIDSILDAYNEELSAVKQEYETKLTESNGKIEELNRSIETYKNDPEKVSKADYDAVIKEREELSNRILQEGRKTIMRKYSVDDDFLDLVLSKVELGKDDKEFETNVEKFAKENPKFVTNTKIINSNPDLTGGKTENNANKQINNFIRGVN